MESICSAKRDIVNTKAQCKMNFKNKDENTQPSVSKQASVKNEKLQQTASNSNDQMSEGKVAVKEKYSNGCENKTLCDKLKTTHLDSAAETEKTLSTNVDDQNLQLINNSTVQRDSNCAKTYSGPSRKNNHSTNMNKGMAMDSTATSSSSDFENKSHYFPSTNPFHPDNNMTHTRQAAPFIKSQSLDLCNESPFLHGVIEPPSLGLRLAEYRDKRTAPTTWLQDSIEENEAIPNESVVSITENLPEKSNNSENMTSAPYTSCEVMATGDEEKQLSPKSKLSSKLQSLDSRPIYPNIPYSPYNSPHSNRRRLPLRESRRVSIERSGSFLQLNQYKLMDQIGQGSYGLVKLAYSEEDSTHYAMKILSKRRLLKQAGLLKRGPKKSTSPLDRVYREIAVLKKLDHPNVVKLIEVLDDPMEDFLYMVFELVKHGEVLSIPTNKPLTEERAWSVIRDTILGLEYLHFQKIIHGDLKPANLLLTECGHVKIADLGVCNEFFGEDATISNGSTAGTPAFRAPETLSPGQFIYCGKASDIWALGTTLYTLVYGDVPFKAQTIPVLYEKIKNDSVEFPETPKVSDDLIDCINCMLTKDPVKRITLPELKEHPWITSRGLYPLPSEDENCCLVQINDEDINSVVRSIPKLDTLILIKTMLKKHSFGNPFNRGISGRAPQRGGSRMERFIRAGRSNSAPGAYNMAIARQLSSDSILPSLMEHNSNIGNEESESKS